MVDRHPQVFISYSQDSDDHANRVLALADRLRAEGINVALDQYETSPPEGWPSWMERQVRESDFVLVVCTEVYCRRAERQEEPGTGYGVTFESTLGMQHLYDTGMRNTRFIPVVFEGRDMAHVPTALRGANRYNICTEDGYEQLYRHLTDQPETPPPVIGPWRRLPGRERQWRPPPRIVDRGDQPAGPRLYLRQIWAKPLVDRYATCEITAPRQRHQPGEPLSVDFAAFFHTVSDDLPHLRRVEVGISIKLPSTSAERRLGFAERYQCRNGIEIEYIGLVNSNPFAWKVRAPEADGTLHGRNAVPDEPLFELMASREQRITLQMVAFANNDDFAPSRYIDIPPASATEAVISRTKEAILRRLKLKQLPSPRKNGEIVLCETDNVVEEVRDGSSS